MKRLVALAVLALLAALAWSAAAGAQSAVDVRANDARSDFPNGLVFNLEVAGEGIEEVRLIYEIAPDGVRTTAEPECTGGGLMSCSFQLAASRQNVIIPGAEATYFWRITAGGQTTETEPRVVTYDDDRFEWSRISDGNLTIWWYQGSEDDARAVLAAGRESLDRVGALLQTEVEIPVKILWYASAQDLAPAILPSLAEGVVTAGEVVYSDTAMVSGGGATEVARHEIAHIVVRQAVGAVYDVPDWLNEGLAVYAQSSPFSDQEQALARAIESGDVLSVRSLSSASSGATADRVSLFYGQSYSLVDFLLTSFGEQKFAQLFGTFSEGATTAEALQQVYGFDQDGLENAWRQSVGLPPRSAPTPDVDQAPAVPPSPTPEARSLPVAASDGDGVPAGIIVGIVVLVVALLGALVGAGVLLVRRYDG